MDQIKNPTVTAMEGDGFYNRNSAMQAVGIARILPIWEKVAGTVPVGDETLVIADYGSSQGRNSMAPMRIAIAALRAKSAPGRTVTVIHTDLPSNDFASLFQALGEEPDSYMKGATGIFPSAVGRSYFKPIIAPGTVHLGWNSWTLQWLSNKPIEISDHIHPEFSENETARHAVIQQAARDWRDFIAARSSELRPGARLLCLFASGPARQTNLGLALWRTLGGRRRYEPGGSSRRAGTSANDAPTVFPHAGGYQGSVLARRNVSRDGDRTCGGYVHARSFLARV